MIRTDRLHIVPVTLELARAETKDKTKFSELLGAAVPDNWPPETLADALDFFLDLLERNPSWSGWLGWYALARTESKPDIESEAAQASWTLVGSIGFRGAPDDAGDVEIGYSVLPQFQGKGYASEMAGGLVGWAFSHPTVRRVLAQTTSDNLGSLGVLRKLGFVAAGPGTEENNTMFALLKIQSANT